jgi:hypothetical protein
LAIAAHHEDETVAEDAATQVGKLVSSWPVDRAEDVARAHLPPLIMAKWGMGALGKPHFAMINRLRGEP